MHNQISHIFLEKTRSNRNKGRLEILYFALGELETVFKQWRQLVDLDDVKLNKAQCGILPFFMHNYFK